MIAAIQLCYDKSSTERAVTWSPPRGHEHFRVDAGEDSPLRNETPLLVADVSKRSDRRDVPAGRRGSRSGDPVIRRGAVAGIRRDIRRFLW
jgi:hypothetical protein